MILLTIEQAPTSSRPPLLTGAALRARAAARGRIWVLVFMV